MLQWHLGLVPGLVLNGQVHEAPGLTCTNWLDDPRLRLKREDYRTRPADTWLRAIVLHTTKGIPGGDDLRSQVIKPGLGPSVDAGLRCVNSWSLSPAVAGAHICIDFDGEIFQFCDLVTEAAQHCPGWNQNSVGIEIYQGAGAELYDGQLDVTVLLCDWLTKTLGIQRQIPHQYIGPVRRFIDHPMTVVGVIGHRDVAHNRGRGDPGSEIFKKLGAAGYEDFNFNQDLDRAEWRRRQRELGIDPADGIPGKGTVAGLRVAGYVHGIWIERPGD